MSRGPVGKDADFVREIRAGILIPVDRARQSLEFILAKALNAQIESDVSRDDVNEAIEQHFEELTDDGS